MPLWAGGRGAGGQTLMGIWCRRCAGVHVLPFPLFSSLYLFSSLFLSFTLALPCLAFFFFSNKFIRPDFDFFFPNLHLMAVSPEDALLHTVVPDAGVFPNSCRNLPGNQPAKA